MYHTSYDPQPGLSIEHVCSQDRNDMLIQHYHEGYEVYLQTAGERTLFLGDVCYRLRAGDLYLLRPFEIHHTQGTGEAYERYVMYLPPDALYPILTQNETKALLDTLESCVLHLTQTQADSLLGMLQTAQEYTRRRGFLSHKLLASSLLQILMQLSELLAHRQKGDALNGEHMDAQIVSVLHYINRHYQEQLTLEQAARLAHMSKYHFCRTFHGSTGATFLEYLTNIRLANAHQLLTETALSLNQVALRCGFSSTAQMTRVFRKVYGMPPRQFRKGSDVHSI